MRIWQGICLSAVVLVSFANACHAQSVTPEDEYKQLIKMDQCERLVSETPPALAMKLIEQVRQTVRRFATFDLFLYAVRQLRRQHQAQQQRANRHP